MNRQVIPKEKVHQQCTHKQTPVLWTFPFLHIIAKSYSWLSELPLSRLLFPFFPIFLCNHLGGSLRTRNMRVFAPVQTTSLSLSLFEARCPSLTQSSQLAQRTGYSPASSLWHKYSAHSCVACITVKKNERLLKVRCLEEREEMEHLP